LEDKVQWTREESLSTIAIAEFVELPERKAIHSSHEENENLIGRMLRQISDAQVCFTFELLRYWLTCVSFY